MNSLIKIEYILVAIIALVFAVDFLVRRKKNKESITDIDDVKDSKNKKYDTSWISKNKMILAILPLLVILGYIVIKPLLKPDPIFLDENGITIKAQPWAKVGDQALINDILYTVVDRDTLEKLIKRKILLNNVCTTLITEMDSLFFENESFNQDISYWDVSNVNDMRAMFRGAFSFNQPLNNWDVSNVNDMAMMFYNAESFNQDIGDWDVSKVKNRMGFSVTSMYELDGVWWSREKVIRFANYLGLSLDTYLKKYNIKDTRWTLPKPRFKEIQF